MTINPLSVATQGLRPGIDVHSIATHGFSFRSVVGEVFVYVVEGLKSAKCYISTVANTVTIASVFNYCKSLVTPNTTTIVNTAESVDSSVSDNAPVVVHEAVVVADCIPSIDSNTTSINIILNSTIIENMENVCSITTEVDSCESSVAANTTVVSASRNTCTVTTKYWSGYGS